MLYEKIFLFLWWWLVFIAFVEFVSIALWIRRLLCIVRDAPSFAAS